MPEPIQAQSEPVAALVAIDDEVVLAATHMFTDVWVSRALPDLLELTANWHPDLIVHEEEEYAGVLLAAIVVALAPHFTSVVLSTGPNAVDTLGVLPLNVHAMPYSA